MFEKGVFGDFIWGKGGQRGGVAEGGCFDLWTGWKRELAMFCWSLRRSAPVQVVTSCPTISAAFNAEKAAERWGYGMRQGLIFLSLAAHYSRWINHKDFGVSTDYAFSCFS